jgi:uncharacterized protein (DUF433 family)
MIEQTLRETEFPGIEFRHSSRGRQPYLRGTRLPVWQVIRLAEEYGGDPAAVATHLHCPAFTIQDALRYAATFPEEIAAATAAGSPEYDDLKRHLPNLHLREVLG